MRHGPSQAAAMTSSRSFKEQGELTRASRKMSKGKAWELKEMLALGEQW